MITVEYIWLDGSEFMPQLRGKTRVFDDKYEISFIPEWSFDGGSTQQGTLDDSDRILKPSRVYKDPFAEGGYLALCEVMMPDGTPHPTNARHPLSETLEREKEGAVLGMWEEGEEPWFGFEQEYTITNPDGSPIVPGDLKQGDFYCGVGAGRVIGRALATEHLDSCQKAGVKLFGVNAEVMLSQWEYQTRPTPALQASDDLWISRYILERCAERHNVLISYHPKIYEALNGAGCHTNISTKGTREKWDSITSVIDKLEESHDVHMEVYGKGNELRLTGDHETSDLGSFSWGIGDRGASVRVPAHVKEAGCGYVEDRRPASSCDPYLVTNRILQTLTA